MLRMTWIIIVFALANGCRQGTISSGRSEAGELQLVKLIVTPSQMSLAAGNTGQLQATGEFSDGSTAEVTDKVTWSLAEASSADVATVSNETGKRGLVTANLDGSVQVVASLDGQEAAAGVVITSSVLEKIEVSSKDKTLRVLLVQQFKATGHFSDGTEKDLTAVALWESSRPDVAVMQSDAEGRGTGRIKKAGETDVIARFGDVEGKLRINVPDVSLTELKIEPADPWACAGKTLPLTAKGTYADGTVLDLTSAVQWSTADAAIVTISGVAGEKGTATAKQRGPTQVTAALVTSLGDLTATATFVGVEGLGLVQPVGGETLFSGAPTSIKWASCGQPSTDDVTLSFSSQGESGPFVSLGTAAEADKTFTWTPATNTVLGRIKIERTGTPTVSDVSAADFTVRDPYIEVTSQVAATAWTWGSAQTVTWQSGGITGSVLIEFSTDAGATWDTLATVADNGSYQIAAVGNWATTQGKIRVSSVADAAVSDINDGIITVTLPTLTVTAPNTAVALGVGNPAAITWTAPGMPSAVKVKIELSKDGGTSWQVLAAEANNTLSYTWTPTSAQKTLEGRIRITATTEASITDASDVDFAVVSQAVVVTAPNGGETLYTGQATNLTWNADASATGTVNVKYSGDGGATWATIGSAVDVQDESFSWTPSAASHLSTQARIRVELTAFPAVGDDSNANFTVKAPNVTLTAPNGSESLTFGSAQTITWTKGGTTENVKIEFSGDNGSTWSTLAASASGTSYSWTVSQAVTAQALVRVTAVTTTTLTDVSDAAFAIVAPNLAVTAPNGGETLYIGAASNITWSTASLPGNVDLAYTKDGTTFIDIATGQTNDGSYSWTVPNDASTTVKVRVRLSAEASVGDLSDANFTIKAPGITLTAPNGGESWTFGTTHNITWTKEGFSENVKVEFSGDNGSTWSTLAASATGTSYSWTISQAVTAQALVRVTAVTTTSITDSSNAVFAVTLPNLAVTAPDGGETLYIGASSTVTWDTASLAGTVDIAYTKDGTTFVDIATGEANDGTYAWTVPNDASTTVKVRVKLSAQASVFDLSDANFTIKAPSITLTSPNGGESWSYASARNITWTKEGFSENVKIEFSGDNGSTWSTLAASATGTSYSWTISQAVTAQALVRITGVTTTSVTDTSNAVFAISQPNLAVTAPNGGEILYIGATSTLTWDTASLAGNVELAYTKDGSTFVDIAADEVNDGSYAWTVPNDASTTVRVRVRLKAQTSVFDLSDANFTIKAPFVQVSAPNGGESWNFASAQTITWTHGGITGNATVALSLDGGSTWTTLGTAVITAGSYSYTVTAGSTTQARVKVTSDTTASITDSSDADFTIANVPSLTVTAPNGSETWYTANSQAVTWTVGGSLSGTVSILLSKDGGSTYATTVATGVAASAGTYAWTPATADITTQGRIRVVSDSYSFIKDESNANFTVKAPFVTLTAPNGSESWAAGASQNVTWTSGGFTGNVKIELSTDGGSTYGTTVIASTTNSGTYAWTIPSLSSTTARLKVTSLSSPSIADASDANFTLVNGSAYVIRGSLSGNTTKSSIDAVAQTAMCGDGLCTGSADAYTIPNGVSIGSLDLRNGAYVIIPASSTATIDAVSVDNSSTLVVNKAVTFASLTVTSGTVTTTAYSGSYSSSTWTPAPGPGNGRVDITTTGAITIGSSGVISADALGFPGGTCGVGYSQTGSAGGAVNGGGTYGTVGTGSSSTVFGASDFYLSSNIYLGSGGGASDYVDYDGGSGGCYTGGRGGGGIRLVAASFTNAGLVTANGQKPASPGGGGSGGSVVIDVTGDFSTSNMIRAAGGAGTGAGAGGLGRIYLSAGSVTAVTGTVTPMPDASFLADVGASGVTDITLSSTSFSFVKSGTTFTFGGVPVGTDSYSTVIDDYAASGIASVTISGGNHRISSTISIGTLTLSGGILDVTGAASITNLNMTNGTLYLKSAFGNHPNYTQNGGTAYFQAEPTFNDFTLGASVTSTVTSIAYSGTWNGSAWSSTPGPGNGQVRFNVNGAATIGASGKILAEGLGYPSSDNGNGGSFDGFPGTGGGIRSGNGGGTYGTKGTGGTGTPFGYTDFHQDSKLYLGSAGAGSYWVDYDGGSGGTNPGARGGGSIRITAGSLSNAGTLSANGASQTYNQGGGGSGGSVVLKVTNAFANTGTIRSLGGSGIGFGNGGLGRTYISAASVGTMTGTITPFPHHSFLASFDTSGGIDSLTLTSTAVAMTIAGTSYSFGQAQASTADDVASVINGFAGYTVNTLNVSSGNHRISASGVTVSAINLTGGTFSVSTAFANAPNLTQTAGTLYLSTTPTFGNMNIGSGGSVATVTTAAYSGTWNGSAWSTTPAPGNGQLLLNASDITLGTNGRIMAEGLGYIAPNGPNGSSYDGVPGTGGGRSGGGGAYGTLGTGPGSPSVFGAADFATVLYLGSSGSGTFFVDYDGGSGSWSTGGTGGGAIKISCANLTNAGIISANGQNGSSSSGGSGGTLILDVTGQLANTGTIRASGGTGSYGNGGAGRVRITSGSQGTMTGTVTPASD